MSWKRMMLLPMITVFLCASTPAHAAPEFSWVPVDASAPYRTARPDGRGEDTEIILAAGTGSQIVEFEVRISGWGSAPGAPTLGAAQAGLDLPSLLGVNADPSQPGLDLTLLNNQPWRENLGGNGLNDGAFIVAYTCQEFIPPSTFASTGIPCGSIPGTIAWAPCPPEAPNCERNPEYLFGFALNGDPYCPDYPCISWGGVGPAGVCTTDDGVHSYYLGTLVMNVPAGFVGSYRFGIDPSPSKTFVNDCTGSAIPDLILTPGHVTLVPGACCDRTAGTCADQVHPADCQPPLRYHEESPFCADLPDRDGDGVPDCADLCPQRDDTLYAPDCIVPALSPWGLLVLALLLLAGITMRFDRRRASRRSAVCFRPSAGGKGSLKAAGSL